MLTIDQYNGAPAIKRLGRLLAEQTIEHLASRNMSGYYYDTKEDAANAVMEMLPKGA
jgi:hypothetical protein